MNKKYGLMTASVGGGKVNVTAKFGKSTIEQPI
jgi:hypothetical protein